MHSCHKWKALGLTTVICMMTSPALAGGFERVTPPTSREAGEVRVTPEQAGANVDVNHRGGWHSYVAAEKSKSPVPTRFAEEDTSYTLSAGTAVTLSENREKLRSTQFIVGYSVTDTLADGQASGLGTSGALPSEADHRLKAGFKLNF